MNTLINKQCRHYSEDESALNLSEIEQLREFTPEWQYNATENELVRVFHFSDFHQTIDFVNRLAEVVHVQDHHPQLHLSYNRCKVSFNTHTVRGITENDFICAARIDLLAA
ncbi:MAG: 4a-hydroxytetrahydrobiopterin dehydratase [Gammaproteobacteria bacterium]|nr:4a-hydroxytetrahydrobiopterin dehydratase [Gammaproteobacteria bacterium]